MPAKSPYAREIFHGKLLDNATIAALQQAEEDLDYELTILQGVGGATASAGTHLGLNGEGGRAVDLAPWDAAHKLRVLKELGFAAWHRRELPGVWGEHIHAVLILSSIGNKRGVAPAAFNQIGSFIAGHDGLKGDGPDLDTFRVTPQPVFKYPPKVKPVRPQVTAVSKARDAVVELQANALRAAALLGDANPARVKARKELDDLRAIAKAADGILERMPRK